MSLLKELELSRKELANIKPIFASNIIEILFNFNYYTKNKMGDH